MISYGGLYLPVEEPEGGDFAQWFDRFQSLHDLRDQGPSPSLVSNRAQAIGDLDRGVNLPIPNYPAPPRIKLSTLYWPTGAARWARCYVLATETQAANIWARASSGATLPLIMGDPGATQLLAQMSCLPPRPITCVDDEKLYLLPLVDARYWWQFEHVDLSITAASTTWANVITSIGTGIGGTITVGTVSADYFRPDPTELTRKYDNAALLLDAVAHTLGMRVVVTLAGAVSLESFATAATTYAQNQNMVRGIQIAGGDFSTFTGSQPDVTVSFRKYWYGGVTPQLRYTVGSGGKVIHSTAFADFSTDAADPDNLTDLQTLATKIGADFALAHEKQYDFTFAGVAAWTPCAYDDHIEWEHFHRHECGEYQSHTRVQSAPHNFGVEEQLSQFTDMPVLPNPCKGKLSDPLPYGGDADAVAWEPNSGGTEASTGYTVSVHPWMIPTGKQVPDGDEIVMAFIPAKLPSGKNWWYAINASSCLEDIPP